MIKKNKKQNLLSKAFTLIEISIVLVIIGLLAGGVLIASTMVENSKLSVLAEEKALLVSATKQFQDKYYSLPGDFNQAEGLWGGGFSAGSEGLNSGTINGTGDGIIYYFGGTVYEGWGFWHHLALAGLMPFEYSGYYNGGLDYAIRPGRNAPPSQWQEQSGWYVVYVGSVSSGATFYDGDYGHVFMLPTDHLFAPYVGTMTPEQQLRLDKKFDDGFPHSGKIRAAKTTYAGSCVTGSSPNYIYDKTQGIECTPIWITGF